MTGLRPWARAMWIVLIVVASTSAWSEPRKHPPQAAAPDAADLLANRDWPEAPKYRLPWPGRISANCVQGNFGKQTHLQDCFNHYAWDFTFTLGDPVCAAREGRVHAVVDNGPGGKDNDNKILIAHEDGEVSAYCHIRTGSAKVKAGDAVVAGQPIAECGTMQHFHFVVWDKTSTRSIAAGFLDVKEKLGVALTGRNYTSQNALITEKTMAEGSARLAEAQRLLESGKTQPALALLLKLGESPLISGNDRRAVRALLDGIRTAAETALAAVHTQTEAGQWREAHEALTGMIKTYAGLPLCNDMKTLLKEVAKKDREATAAARPAGH